MLLCIVIVKFTTLKCRKICFYNVRCMCNVCVAAFILTAYFMYPWVRIFRRWTLSVKVFPSLLYCMCVRDVGAEVLR